MDYLSLACRVGVFVQKTATVAIHKLVFDMKVIIDAATCHPRRVHVEYQLNGIALGNVHIADVSVRLAQTHSVLHFELLVLSLFYARLFEYHEFLTHLSAFLNVGLLVVTIRRCKENILARRRRTTAAKVHVLDLEFEEVIALGLETVRASDSLVRLVENGSTRIRYDAATQSIEFALIVCEVA